MPNRRDSATLIGLGLLGAGGLMLLHNSSVPKPAPAPAPTPLPPAPVATTPPGTSSGGVPPLPAPRSAPAPAPALSPTARVAAPVTFYLVRNLNGSIRLRTPNKGQAIATAVATRVAGVNVRIEGGAVIYVVPGAIAKRQTSAYVPPKVSVYAGQATLSTSGRSL